MAMNVRDFFVDPVALPVAQTRPAPPPNTGLVTQFVRDADIGLPVAPDTYKPSPAAQGMITKFVTDADIGLPVERRTAAPPPANTGLITKFVTDADAGLPVDASLFRNLGDRALALITKFVTI